MAETVKAADTAKKTAKPDETKPSETPEAVSTPAKALEPRQKAAESSDPAVHLLLAELQTHTSNGDTDAAAAVEAKLNKLGFTL